jgi:predicted nucleic acid-binding protein
VKFFLLDTNVLSELVRPSPSPAVVRFLGENDDLWLSVITLHELAFGLARVDDARRRAKLEGFLAAMKNQFDGRILHVGVDVAEMAGRLRAFAGSERRFLHPQDSLIAATAVAQGATLATRNVKDFDFLEISLVNPWDG